MAFTPFSIQCITCGTRLRVTDPALIGQLTFCLKCQSIVEVTPPDSAGGTTADEAPPVADVSSKSKATRTAPKETASAKAAPDEVSPPPVEATQPVPVAAAGPPDVDERPRIRPVVPEVSSGTKSTDDDRTKRAAAVAPLAALAAPEVFESSEPPLPGEAVAPPPMSGEAAASALAMPTMPEPIWKQYFTLGVSAFSGMALATSIWLYWSASQVTAPPEESKTADAGPVTPTAPEPAAEADDIKEHQAAPPADVREPATKDNPPVEPDLPPLPALPGDDASKGDPADQPAEAAGDEPGTNDAEPSNERPAADAGRGTSDPLADSEFDFRFDNPLLPPDVEPNLTEDPIKPEPPAVVEPAPIPAPEAPAASAELLQRLETQIPAIRIRSLPLSRFADLISELAGKPVRIDPLAIERLGLSLDSPVAVDSRGATLADLLDLTLAPRGLGYRGLGDTILITTIRDESAYKQVRFRLGDLAGSTSGLEQLAELIRQVISPSSWDTVGGRASIAIDGDSLLIEHGVAERYQIVLLCEKLRVARGLPIQSRFDPSRFELTARSSQAQTGLQKRVTFEPGEALPLDYVLGQLAQQSGMKLQIDFLALASSGLAPEMDARLGVRERPLSEALTKLLDPLGLTAYPLDAQTLVVTTPYALERTVMWELLPAPASLTTMKQVEQWIDELRRERHPESWSFAGGQGAILFDRDSRHFIVRQNPRVLSELAQELGG